MKYSFQYLTETKISAFPAILMVLIFLGVGVKAIIKIKELKDQTQYLEIRAESENEFVDIRQARKNK